MPNGKLIKLKEDYSIYILEAETGDYITNNTIRYKNLGKGYNKSKVEENQVVIENNILFILEENKPIISFPVIWLDTTQMKFLELQELMKEIVPTVPDEEIS
jgi:hypothetical protein